MSELDLRASDGDRERAIDDLRAHAADGRLTDRVSAIPPGPPHRRRSARPEMRAFLAVMVLLVAIWAVTGAGYFWPLWPMVGWGFFVLRPRKHLGFLSCHPSVSSRR
jgi:hypothetical protein